VLDIQLQNKALLLIWIWIANSDETSLWASTLRHVGHHLPLQPTTHALTDASFFLQDLHKLQPIMSATSMTDNQGILRWRLTPNQHFTVHSAYKFLNNPRIPNPTLQRVCQTTMPPKIKIFIWLLLQNKLQTAENLQRKGWPTITVCIMCNTGTQKSANHLFTSCPTAATLSQRTITLPTTAPTCSTGWEAWQQMRTLSMQPRWAAMAWTIWKKRNRKIFQGTYKNVHAMTLEMESYSTQWNMQAANRNNIRID
jgi:zinc-binding in reverse transcriptase